MGLELKKESLPRTSLANDNRPSILLHDAQNLDIGKYSLDVPKFGILTPPNGQIIH